MNNTIRKLEEISRKYDKTSMLAMQELQFEQYFAMIYGELNNFCHTDEISDQRTSSQIIEKCYQLLKTALDHHIATSKSASTNSIKIFNTTLDRLIEILRRDLKVGDKEQKEFESVEIDFRALRACGLTKPGLFQTGTSRRWENKEADEVALKYAAENIAHFSEFVYSIASGQTDSREFLLNSPYRESIELYKNVKNLHANFNLIGSR